MRVHQNQVIALKNQVSLKTSQFKDLKNQVQCHVKAADVESEIRPVVDAMLTNVCTVNQSFGEND